MEEVKAATPVNHKRKNIAILVLAIIAIVGGIGGYFYIQYKKTHITTDDAFIEGRIHTVSSKVPGTIKNVHVADNQFIRKGDLLVEIDPEDFDIRVREASAVFDAERTKLPEFFYRLDASRKRLEELKAMLGAAKANLELQEANLEQAEIDFKRAEGLYKEEIIPKEKYEKAKTAYDIADAQVKATKEQLRQIEASLGTQKINIKQAESAIEPQKALIRQKEASLGAAELNLSYTKVYAPSDGYITRKSAESGNQVQAGQPLMAVVLLDNIWVVANYKETQLENVKPGQKVRIKVDTYPNRIFKGRFFSRLVGRGLT